MEFYIVTSHLDPLNYVLSQKNFLQNPVVCHGATATEEALYTAHIINDFHLFIERQLASGLDITSLSHKLLLRNPSVIIISKNEKLLYNGHNGQINHANQHTYHEPLHSVYDALMSYSQKVVHICQDELTILKENKDTVLCSFIRHGQTIGNVNKCYIGSTDESLCTQGIHELQSLNEKAIYPVSDLLYVSPMKRCSETARLLYPSHHICYCHSLKECDFGDFENKSYKELDKNSLYQQWIDSYGHLPFPNGEDRQNFIIRSVEGFLTCINHAYNHIPNPSSPKWTTFIVHGGTIMSILSELTEPKQDYYHFQTDNGHGYLCEYHLNTNKLIILDTF